MLYPKLGHKNPRQGHDNTHYFMHEGHGGTKMSGLPRPWMGDEMSRNSMILHHIWITVWNWVALVFP